VGEDVEVFTSYQDYTNMNGGGGNSNMIHLICCKTFCNVKMHLQNNKKIINRKKIIHM
jgi:hypothetical protein